MTIKSSNTQQNKSGLHPNNKHQSQYDFDKLVIGIPELNEFVFINKYNTKTIDFTNSEAVKMLNKALLLEYYAIQNWDVPKGYLCPPIPGRADYIHNISDLLSESNSKKTPIGKAVQVLDIGVGANCIYPLIGFKEYGWHFIGTDIDSLSVKVANNIIQANGLEQSIKLKHQKDENSIFKGVLNTTEFIDVSICNPPFHSSAQEANAGSSKKWKNLGYKKTEKAVLNFGGQTNELCCKGGEIGFITKMIAESVMYKENCLWFTTLVSKSDNLKSIYYNLQKNGAVKVKTINMEHGNKISRIVAWSFLDDLKHLQWSLKRWGK